MKTYKLAVIAYNALLNDDEVVFTDFAVPEGSTLEKEAEAAGLRPGWKTIAEIPTEAAGTVTVVVHERVRAQALIKHYVAVVAGSLESEKAQALEAIRASSSSVDSMAPELIYTEDEEGSMEFVGRRDLED